MASRYQVARWLSVERRLAALLLRDYQYHKEINRSIETEMEQGNIGAAISSAPDVMLAILIDYHF
jgi:hypothetical protein